MQYLSYRTNLMKFWHFDALTSTDVPLPFLKAIFKQESNLKHFYVPRGADEDNYIVVGMDTNAGEKYIITSRGYGLGQFTLFHHPPKKSEVKNFMVGIRGNISKAIAELRDKFEYFVTGPPGGRRADDRFADGRTQKKPLVCQYEENDSRYLTDCKTCAMKVGKQDIVAEETPLLRRLQKYLQENPIPPRLLQRCSDPQKLSLRLALCHASLQWLGCQFLQLSS